MTLKVKVILTRFAKGFLASAVGAAVLIVPSEVSGATDIQEWLLKLGVVGFVSGISGGLQALDKYLRWEDDPQ